jgi:hypothetical protein
VLFKVLESRASEGRVLRPGMLKHVEILKDVGKCLEVDSYKAGVHVFTFAPG